MRLETLSIYAYDEKKIKDVYAKVEDWHQKSGRGVFIAQYENKKEPYDGCICIVFWVFGTSRENTERALGIRHDPELQIMWEIADALDSQERIACKLNARHHKDGKWCTKAQYVWFDWEDVQDLRQVNLADWSSSEDEYDSDVEEDWKEHTPTEEPKKAPVIPGAPRPKRRRGGVVPETP